jgi:Cu+-exporting ATPase
MIKIILFNDKYHRDTILVIISLSNMSLVKDRISSFCYHCGENCNDNSVQLDDKTFCCEGCKAVFQILDVHNLCEFYSIDGEAGLKVKEVPFEKRFDYLDDQDIINKIVEFNNKNLSSITFTIPEIHCSSCIWLLERINKVNPGVINSRVDFLQKRVSILYDNEKTTLKEVVKTLVSVGYEPNINLDTEFKKKSSGNIFRDLYARIGVAGFCLGNIMLLSFPEYLSIGDTYDQGLKNIFNYLNILLGIPVITYCSSPYFISAWKGVKNRFINIDVPISLGLLALFLRSIYEIVIHSNAGFMDSLAGLVFFLLIGKLFQSKTYESINFERDYKSYFPIFVTCNKKGAETCIPVSKLNVGDRIIIRNNEIIPVDAILFSGEGYIDYSFVTGESIPEQKVLGEIIYAGGKHLGSAIELEVLRTVSQSYLTQLWNDKAFDKTRKPGIETLTNLVSKYFTIAILLIAFTSAFYWLPTDIDKALTAFTTVLIIACPCALALTTPFALGNSLRILGKNKFYLRDSFVIEAMSKIDSIVLDKTGTITNTKDLRIEFIGSVLSDEENDLIKSLVRNSTHPLSRRIHDSLSGSYVFRSSEFEEIAGEGISGNVEGRIVRLGNIRYVLGDAQCTFQRVSTDFRKNMLSTNVFLSIDNEVKGFYSFNSKYRDGLETLLNELSKKYDISLISGDKNHERTILKKFFEDDQLHFDQMPSDKLRFVKSKQKRGNNVMMIGDGLNDAGALKQSDIGVSVTEDVASFSPACDIIMDAQEFSKLGLFMNFARSTMMIIKASFVISFIYNVIGLYLASQGTFSPLIAAILMPFNSISIVLFVVGMTNISAKRRKLI